MNLKKLQYFIAVSESLSFTAAAKKLFMTQPPLSRQIAELEEEVGVPLLKRTKQGVTLTSEGKYFLEQAKAVISQQEELMFTVDQLRQGGTGLLRVGYYEIMDYDFMVEVIKHISKQYPMLKVFPVRKNFGALMYDLRNGELDVVYASNVILENVPGISWYTIGQSKLQLAVSSSHPLADKSIVKLREVAEEPFIKLARRESPMTTDTIIELCLKNGFSPNIIMEPIDLPSQLILVAANLGVSIVSDRLAHRIKLSNIRYIDIDDPAADMSLNLAWKNTDYNPKAILYAEAVKKLIEEAVV